MREALADVGRRALWTEEQRRALRSAFQAIVDAFDGVVLLRGVEVKQTLTMADLPLSVDVRFTARPRAVWVLSATQVSDGTVITNPPVQWTHTQAADRGVVTLTDIDLLDNEEYSLDIIMVKP